MAGIVLALTIGNAYPLTTARMVTPLLQISVVGLGAGMNLIEVGHAGVHGFFYTVIGITLTLAAGLALGRALGTERDTSLLVTVWQRAICGGSAIAAVARTIRAGSRVAISGGLGDGIFPQCRCLVYFSSNWPSLRIEPAAIRNLERAGDSRHQFGGRSGHAIWRTGAGNRDDDQVDAGAMDRTGNTDYRNGVWNRGEDQVQGRVRRSGRGLFWVSLRRQQSWTWIPPSLKPLRDI